MRTSNRAKFWRDYRIFGAIRQILARFRPKWRDSPADAHDILAPGTWRLVSDSVEMARTPRDADELLDLPRRRHATLMAARPDMGPGIKREPNRAEQTVFFDPGPVEGTLRQGFDYYRSLGSPFARAVYMMFPVSEVHPFADGNGHRTDHEQRGTGRGRGGSASSCRRTTAPTTSRA